MVFPDSVTVAHLNDSMSYVHTSFLSRVKLCFAMCHCGKSALTGTLRFLHHLCVRENPVKGLFEVCDIFKWTSWDCSYQLKCFLLFQQSFECFPTSCKDKLCTTEGSLSDRVPTWAWNSVDLNPGSSAYCSRDSGKVYLMGLLWKLRGDSAKCRVQAGAQKRPCVCGGDGDVLVAIWDWSTWRLFMCCWWWWF